MLVVGYWDATFVWALRIASRMSQEELARRLEVADRTVRGWEAGATISLAYQQLLDVVLQRADGETKARFSHLARARVMADLAALLTEEDDTDRASFVRRLFSGFAAAFLPGEALDRVTDDRWFGVDATLVAAHERLSAELAAKYRHGNPRILLPLVSAYADDVLGLLNQPMADAHRARLDAVVVGAHAQAGMTAFNAGRWAVAYRHLVVAVDVAAVSGDPALHAHALGMFGYLFSSFPRGGRGGNPVRSLALFDRAVEESAKADGWTRGWLRTWRADQHATCGDVEAALVDVDAADLAFGEGVAPARGFWSRATYGDAMEQHLDSVRGVALALVGHDNDADQAFDRVLTLPANIHRQANTFGHIGLVRARAGALDGASEALLEGLDAAEPAGYAMGVERIRGVRAQFRDGCAGLACVRALDERLRTLN